MVRVIESQYEHDAIPVSENTVKAFQDIAKEVLPNFYHEIAARRSSFDGSYYIRIVLAVSDFCINRVAGQYIQCVSLNYDAKDEVLTTQVFGGNGGNRIYVMPYANSYNYMEGVKIPFRKSKGLASSLKAFRKFCENYKKELTERKSNLMYQNLIDYNLVLGEF